MKYIKLFKQFIIKINSTNYKNKHKFILNYNHNSPFTHIKEILNTFQVTRFASHFTNWRFNSILNFLFLIIINWSLSRIMWGIKWILNTKKTRIIFFFRNLMLTTNTNSYTKITKFIIIFQKISKKLIKKTSLIRKSDIILFHILSYLLFISFKIDISFKNLLFSIFDNSLHFIQLLSLIDFLKIRKYSFMFL